jgi:hypothetical protein
MGRENGGNKDPKNHGVNGIEAEYVFVKQDKIFTGTGKKC